jgi:hypothetical protein
MLQVPLDGIDEPVQLFEVIAKGADGLETDDMIKLAFPVFLTVMVFVF